MCGRFTLRTPGHRLAGAFGAEAPPDLAPRYNIAPGEDIAVVRRTTAGGREFAWLRWGLIPCWARDAAIGSRMINARAETVRDKPAFRAAFGERRCLVAADGFYEWQKTGGRTKQPWYIRLADDAPFAFAGLWERWRAPGGEAVESCALITVAANARLGPIHHRMPAILPPGTYGDWLDPAPASLDALAALLRPLPDDALAAHPVGRMVNDARNDAPVCIAAPDGR
ncbi:MAG: SOS response-associated peptidase [Alphaproteobacteria bacterium]